MVFHIVLALNAAAICLVCRLLASAKAIRRPLILLFTANFISLLWWLELITFHVATTHIVPPSLAPTLQALNRFAMVASELLYIGGIIWLVLLLVRFQPKGGDRNHARLGED